jgi:hypothetical protein
MRLKYFGNSAKNYSSIYIKFIISHLQIISCLSYLNFTIYIGEVNYVSDPIEATVYSLDCIANRHPYVPLITIRLLWIIIQPLI